MIFGAVVTDVAATYIYIAATVLFVALAILCLVWHWREEEKFMFGCELALTVCLAFLCGFQVIPAVIA